MKEKFKKRIFNAKTFFKDIAFIMYHIPTIIAASRNERISKVFTEKIMSVISTVNGCIYCTWFHAKQAVSCGISKQEVKNLFNLKFEADASDFELPALLYAQHYAENDRNPDPEMTEKFIGYYGEKTARHILIFVRMIYFGNLLGNTWDAVLSRFKGKPAENSNLIFELFFFLLTFWFMGFAMLQIKGKTN